MTRLHLGQETYGEDPFLSGELARSFVQGLQGQHPRYVKASAGCKHFSVHGGPENIPVSRLSFDAKVSAAGGCGMAGGSPGTDPSVPGPSQVLERDWRTTFLPQFQACVRAGSYSFMCSYNRYRAWQGAARAGLPVGWPVPVQPGCPPSPLRQDQWCSCLCQQEAADGHPAWRVGVRGLRGERRGGPGAYHAGAPLHTHLHGDGGR